MPRAGAAVGTGRVYILAGTAGTQLWDGQFVWPSPLWIGQRREYGRRKLTPVGTSRLGASPLTARGSEGGWVTRTLLFIFVSLSLSHTRVVLELAHPRDPRVRGGNPGRLPLKARLWGEGARGREDPRFSLGVRGVGRVGVSRSTLH